MHRLYECLVLLCSGPWHRRVRRQNLNHQWLYGRTGIWGRTNAVQTVCDHLRLRMVLRFTDPWGWGCCTNLPTRAMHINILVFDFFLFLGLSYLVRALFFQSFHTIRIDSKKAVVETWYGAWLRRVNLSEIRSWYETDIDLPKVGRVHRLIIETTGNEWVIASSFHKDYDKLKMLLTLDKPHNRKIAGQIHFKQHRNVAIVQGIGSLAMSLMFFWLFTGLFASQVVSQLLRLHCCQSAYL